MKSVMRASARAQQGVALIVVLILLIVMSILGIVIMRSSAMQERMSANLRDRSLGFQAAEGALRYAQDQVLGAGNWHTQIPTAANCATGICPTGSDPVWVQVPAGTYDEARLAGAVPEYWIEYLGVGPGYKGACDTLPPSVDCQSPMYRVTARSRGVGRADVVVQANIVSRIPEPGT
ncbi:pilus assembly protein [Pseudoxanthomonas sp. PXM03]|jgi:type IV pilus assembly protein PilX|uniref:pilus assembly PilX family protein n=1 Tax=Pseudoxanthomonas sp. PXM03 TaxID=2769284 RepID=UPI00178703A9|nr:PilX N-terminal domain-containing pilus assembly protein [Pseudoxanthomonas sp. PXM03]MBD9435375.1 pilus assembly protein [Pseudoxanthomonas sp. PXM03]